jgi:uncharacterized membrane protein
MDGELSAVTLAQIPQNSMFVHCNLYSKENELPVGRDVNGYLLRQTLGTLCIAAPNWLPWLIFFLRALQQQERRLAAKVERERVVIAALPELDLQIIDYVRQHGRATMADIVRATGASRNTLKDHFRSLVEKGHLTRHGTGKGSWYALP